MTGLIGMNAAHLKLIADDLQRALKDATVAEEQEKKKRSVAWLASEYSDRWKDQLAKIK